MSIVLKLDPITREIDLWLDEQFSDKEKSARFAAFAREQIELIDNENARIVGTRLPYDLWVDGAPDRPLTSVTPKGRIEAEWYAYDELFAYIGDLLVKHSPYGSDDPRPGHPGLYERSHLFLADDVIVPVGKRVPPAKEFVFINAVPYARKIERGLSNQAPDGVYQTVATLARRRWSNLASIRFSYRSLLTGGVAAWAQTTKMSSRNRKGVQRRDWLTRQPAIVITPKG